MPPSFNRTGEIKAWALERIRFTGPGLILAASSSGWIGLLALLGIGADLGYGLLWAVMLVILFKYAFTSGIARYTVASGHDIFHGLGKIPGPAHWELWFICIIYILEIFNHGAGVLVLGVLVQDMLQISFPPALTAAAIFTIIALILLKNSYPLVKKILILTCLILSIDIISTLGSIPIMGDEVLSGLVPGMVNDEIIYYAGIIFWSLGTGLSLLCYSSWLHTQIGTNHGEKYYRNHMKSVQLDLTMGFVILALVSFLYISLGYMILYEHGLAGMESDLTIQIIANTLNQIPFGKDIFVATGIAALIGYLIGGIDGRSRAVASILHQATHIRWDEKRTYQAVVIFFLMIALFAIYVGNSVLFSQTLVFSLGFFGLVGCMLIWVDRTLPEYARGSWLWYGIIGLGSIGYISLAIWYATL